MPARDNRLAARVVGCTFSGATIAYTLARAGATLRAFEPNDGRARHAVGTAVTVRWDPEATVALEALAPSGTRGAGAPSTAGDG